MKPLIHFAHANGIPSQSYQKLFDALSDQYDVIYIPFIGADSHYPITDQWDFLVQQIIDSIETQANGRKVIALGHSLGSLLSLMASRLRPDLIDRVIMLDPPLILGRASFALHILKLLRPSYIDQNTPAGLTIKRRDHWDSRAVAAASLRDKKLFKHFDQQCFDDYIKFALKDDPVRGGVTLSIPKENEANIFRTTPSLWWLPQKALPVPTDLVVGADSEFLKRKFPQIAQKKWNIPYSIMQGGHMFPLEHPIATAQLIQKMLGEHSI